MTNPEYYPAATEFNGFRFVNPELVKPSLRGNFSYLQPKPSKLTDVGETWHVWGTGRMAW